MSSHLTTRGKRQPILPELANVTQKDWAVLYRAGTELAASLLHSKDDASEAVHEAYIDLSTTHRYDPKRHDSLRTHFLMLVRIECLHFISDSSREEAAREGLSEEIDEAYEQEGLSPEQMMVACQDDEAGEARLHRVRARLRKLQKCVSHNAVAVALLEYWAVHGSDRPLSKVAAIIGYTDDEVYEAKELIERKARNILSDEEGEDQ